MRSMLLVMLLAACSRDGGSEKVEVSFDRLSPLQVQGVGAGGPAISPVDLSYSTTYAIEGPDANLTVWPRESGAPVSFKGPRIEAAYSHVGGLLQVKVRKGTTDQWDWHYFVQPVRWDSN